MVTAPPTLEKTYPTGAEVTGTVVRIEPYGVFLRLQSEPPVVGLIRRRDWSWERWGGEFQPAVAKGERVTAKVIAHRRAGLALSRRDTLPDPYPAFRERHSAGAVVTAQVALIARREAGVTVSLEEGVQGFVPRSEMPGYGQSQEGFGLRSGDWVEAEILRFEDADSTVILSLRERLRRRQRARRARSSAETPVLRHHPTVGPALEDYSLSLQLEQFAEPEITPTLRQTVQRILVVEDDDGVSESLELYLELLDFDCDLASSVEEGIARLDRERYDLLILDINLPGGKGLELLRLLGERDDPPYILVVTGAPQCDWEQLQEAALERITGIFQKPTVLARVLAYLDRVLAGEETPDDRKRRADFITDDIAALGPAAGQGSAGIGRRERIEQRLERLRREAGADHAFLLAFEEGPRFELLAGAFPPMNPDVQHNLAFSPVGNVIRRRTFLIENDVARHKARFQHLLEVLPLAAFAGHYLPHRDRSEYGLFLTAVEAGRLGVDREQLARAAGEIGQLLAEERLDEVISENQSLLLTGFLADSLLHEIRNSAEALNHASGIQSQLGKRFAKDLGEMSPEQVVSFKRAIVRVQEEAREIGEVIELFRNLAGQTEEEEIELDRSLARLVTALGPLAEGKSVTIETDLDPELPELRLTPRLLEQPLLNVMINAIEQMALTGSPERVLGVSTRFDDKAELPVTISVADTGPGIHAVHSERIFDLFFTTKPRGTGLGLYLSRYFLERLGGRIRLARSVMFSGSEFLIELPREVLA